MSNEQMPAQEVVLSPEQQKQLDADIQALKSYGEAHGLRQLEGRVAHGLDPSGMLAVPEARALATKVAEALGTTLDAVEGFITELHTSGPWKNVDKLKQGGTTPEARFYLSLAGVCVEKPTSGGYTPSQYLDDRGRVLSELGVLGGADRALADVQFNAHLQDRVYTMPNKEIVDVDGEKIVIASGDPFIGMAAEGFEGGISKTGQDEDLVTMYFVGTSNINPSSLEATGMVLAYAEVFDPETQSMKRVEVDSEEGKKGRVVFAEAS